MTSRHLLLGSLTILCLSGPTIGNQISDAYDFRGIQTRKTTFPSGHLSTKIEYHPPSEIPGKDRTYAIKMTTTTYSVINYEPRAPIENVFLVDCNKKTVTTILEIIHFENGKIDLGPAEPEAISRITSELKKNNSISVAKVRDLERVNIDESVYTTAQITAYDLVCGSDGAKS